VRYGFAYGGLIAAGIAFVVATTGGSSVHADALDDVVVARVGAQTITAGELSRRLLGMPPFQLKMVGKTEDEIKRNFLERVLVRDLLLAQGAEIEKLGEQANVEERVRATLRGAMLQDIRLTALSEPISEADVEKYYKDNADKFHAPERIAIWRILVATREDALKIVQEVKKDNSTKRWNDLARERSLDKATHMRGGNLGYVEPDGKTTDPAIVVDRAVVELAKVLKDAELSPEPVKEGDKWAVVWRRQTMKPVERSLVQEAPGIRQTLARQRTEEKLKALLDSVRKERLHEVTPDFVDEITVSAQGDLQPLRRPGVLPSRRPAPGLPQPGHDHR
jgi:peptidyl-prolyl cis-trans isomerase C